MLKKYFLNIRTIGFRICFGFRDSDFEFILKSTILCLITIITLSSFCFAANKNGVSPKTISLPSGPGSIEGLGKSFQPMLNTGTAKYEIEFDLPEGVSGHTPGLSLSYDGGQGDGPAGIGWSFGPGSIRRRTDKGIPRYVDGPNGEDDDHDGVVDEEDEEDILVGIEGEELVKIIDGTYRARIEEHFIRYRRVSNGWEVDLKDGSKLEFGTDPGARITDESGEKIYAWLPEKSIDTHGNVIEYSYTSFPGSTNQKYLKEIRYGPGASPWQAFYFVSLIYEDRPDWRKDYRSGFKIKTTKRLARAYIGIQGVFPDQCTAGDWNGDGTQDALIRRYDITYADHPYLSFLSKITEYGADNASYQPPTYFRYAVFEPQTVISATEGTLFSTNEPFSVMDNELVELIDLNRDSLPDILKTDVYGGGHTCYLNQGVIQQGGARVIQWDYGREVTSPDGLAMQLHLLEKRVHLADMNGDGVSDLVHTTCTDEVYYHLNLGNVSWGRRKRMSIQDTPPPAPFVSEEVKTSDIDFDKRIDIIKSTPNGYSVWFNLDKDKYSREVRTDGAVHDGWTLLFSDEVVDLADMNGDRMNDVVWIRSRCIIYCANMGHGRFDDSVTIPLPDQVLSDGPLGEIKKAKLQDINGDGLADLVIDHPQGANELWYWLNRGTDTLSPKHTITDIPPNYGYPLVTRWADMNGNGTKDLIYADSSASQRIRALDIGELVGGSAHPNLLTEIDNGLGGITHIHYRSSTEFYLEAQRNGVPWSSLLPFPVQVIARVEVTASTDLDTKPGNDVYIKDFIYRDGYYDILEKAFRGFAEAFVIEYGDETAPTQVSNHHFFTGGPDGVDNDRDGDIDEVSPEGHHEDEPLKGKIQELEVRSEDGSLFNRAETDWLVATLLENSAGIEVRFAYSVESRTAIYEDTNSPEILCTTSKYNEFGQVVEEKNYGALSISGDEAFTFTTYINDEERWILGAVATQTITDAAGRKAAETRSYYDGEAYVGLPLGHIEKGDLTRQEGWVSGGKYLNLARSAYDSYGNVIGIMDAKGNLREVEYEDIFHSFPVKEIIHISDTEHLAITAEYNLGLGTMTQSTGFNGHTSQYYHNCFGELVKIVQPGDSYAYPSQSYLYTMADPHRGLIYVYDEEGNFTLEEGITTLSSITTKAREHFGKPDTHDTIQYVDGLGRKLGVIEEAEEGFVINGASILNEKGGVRYSFLPYRVDTSIYQPPPLDTPHGETHYDAAGRELIQYNPPGEDGTVTCSSIQYLPLEKRVTDENNNSQRFISDGLERLIEVNEYNQGQTYTTRYDYDTLGNLTKVTDAQNNVKIMRYDGLKRRVEDLDPDRGKTVNEYDDVGNLIRTTDNKGQVIEYTYDGAGRMLSEDYLDEAGITPDVAYHYDYASGDYPEAKNLKGALAWVEDLSGAQFLSYDDRGKPEWTVKRIVQGGETKEYTSSMTYDALGRVTTLTYPDGTKMSYTYNNRSLLESIPGVVDNIDFTASSQVSSLFYANGLETHYHYDARDRLINLETKNPFQSGSLLQDLTYTFDGVSNITAISDNRDIPADSPQNATQTFQYDDLYRLIKAEGPGYGIIQYQYDKIGNMIWKKSPDAPNPQHIGNALINLGLMSCGGSAGSSNRTVKLPGDPPGPHAVTSTESGLQYDYDDNGNMVGNNDGDTYTWDFQDRLVKVQKQNGTVARYVYDNGGQRVIKAVNDGTGEKVSVYVSEAFEVRDGKTVKYVFAGKRRVARIEDIITDPEEFVEQVLRFQKGWNLFSLEVEPDDPPLEVVLSAIEGRYSEVWNYDTSLGDYRGYVPSKGIYDLTELHAQKGYFIKIDADVPATCKVTGSKMTEEVYLYEGWNLIGCPSNGVLPVAEALVSLEGKYKSVWTYDTGNGRWRCFSPDAPPFLNDLENMEPGRAYWVEMISNGFLSFQDKPERYFYHPDHLGSSNLITNMGGKVVSRTECYPFGLIRYEEHNGLEARYKFTGKERDKESGLDYFGARYYDPVAGKFVSVDPLYVEPDGLEKDELKNFLHNPQKLGLYTYCINDPINMVDPLGLAESPGIVIIAKYRQKTDIPLKSQKESLEELWGKGNKRYLGRGYKVYTGVASNAKIAEILSRGKYNVRHLIIIGHSRRTYRYRGIRLSRRLSRRTMFDYGTLKRTINTKSVKTIKKWLHPDATITLHACFMARSRRGMKHMRKLSKLFGVAIKGYTGESGARGNTFAPGQWKVVNDNMRRKYSRALLYHAILKKFSETRRDLIFRLDTIGGLLFCH